MNESVIIEMGEIQMELDKLNKRMEELKTIAREHANGEQACYVAGDYTVTISKPGKGSTTIDLKKLAVKAPKLHAELMTKYSKTGSPKAAAVKVHKNK